MRCFRLTEHKHSNKVDLLNGKGAERDGGRWNREGTPVSYLGETADVAIVEKGYYSISGFGALSNAQFKPGHKTQDYYIDQASSVCLALATIEIADTMAILNLTDEEIWKQTIQKAEIGSYSIQDSRKSPYFLLPGHWTQRLSHYIEHNTDAKGIRVASARHAEGRAVVLFSNKINHEHVELVTVEDVTLKCPALLGKSKLSASDILKIEIDYRGESKTLNVCEFPF